MERSSVRGETAIAVIGDEPGAGLPGDRLGGAAAGREPGSILHRAAAADEVQPGRSTGTGHQ